VICRWRSDSGNHPRDHHHHRGHRPASALSGAEELIQFRLLLEDLSAALLIGLGAARGEDKPFT